MQTIRIYQADVSVNLALPFLLDRLSCGFTSPADDYIDHKLDLNEHLIKKPNSTFFGRAIGDSMVEANIRPNDIVVVDRSLTPQSGSLVLAVLDGEFMIKRLRLVGDRILLVPENPKYPVREVQSGQDFQVWGVVTYTIHSHL